MHLVGFIIRMYQEARSSECQIQNVKIFVTLCCSSYIFRSIKAIFSEVIYKEIQLSQTLSEMCIYGVKYTVIQQNIAKNL